MLFTYEILYLVFLLNLTIFYWWLVYFTVKASSICRRFFTFDLKAYLFLYWSRSVGLLVVFCSWWYEKIYKWRRVIIENIGLLNFWIHWIAGGVSNEFNVCLLMVIMYPCIRFLIFWLLHIYCRINFCKIVNRCLYIMICIVIDF